MQSSPTYGQSSTLLAFPNLDFTKITSRHIYACIQPFLSIPSTLISVSIHRSQPNLGSTCNTLIAVAKFTSTKMAEHVYHALNYVEIENSGNYLDPHFLHREVGEKISECLKQPNDLFECNVMDEDNMERMCMMNGLFDDSDGEMESDMVNMLVEVSDECIMEDNCEESVSSNVNTISNLNTVDTASTISNLSDQNKNKLSENKQEKNENDISKRSKGKNKKKMKSKKDKLNDNKDFKVNINDDRFKRVFEEDEFKIDVTHNLYKNNPSVKEIVKEKRKRLERE